MTTKKYKMISITYTNKCLKEPRCSFCYLDEGHEESFSSHLTSYMLKEAEQTAVAYNGIDLKVLIDIIKWNYTGTLFNITTNPMFMTRNLAVVFKRYNVQMVALSLDYEKSSIQEWAQAAEIVKDHEMLVGANILMLDNMYKIIDKLIPAIQPQSDQIHLLRPKFYRSEIDMETRKDIIFLLKQQYDNLFIDECFKNEFQGIPCSRGKDFVSINPDNSVSLCSFDRDGIVDVQKCPYI